MWDFRTASCCRCCRSWNECRRPACAALALQFLLATSQWCPVLQAGKSSPAPASFAEAVVRCSDLCRCWNPCPPGESTGERGLSLDLSHGRCFSNLWQLLRSEVSSLLLPFFLVAGAAGGFYLRKRVGSISTDGCAVACKLPDSSVADCSRRPRVRWELCQPLGFNLHSSTSKWASSLSGLPHAGVSPYRATAPRPKHC